MVLDGQRARADIFLVPVAKRLINVNPNIVSWLGLIVALASGIVFYLSGSDDTQWLLLVGSALVIISGYFDALDGKIAKMAGKCSIKGDYLDHVFDRYADVFMIGGIAMCIYWCSPHLGILAIIGVLLTSYMGTQAQAIGAPRLYAGLLGRADRVVLSTIFPIVQYVMLFTDYSSFIIDLGFKTFDVNWLEIMMLWYAIAGNFTAIQRAIITWKNLGKMEAEKKEKQ
jgi:archaetidylinositol phosphate synthase